MQGTELPVWLVGPPRHRGPWPDPGSESRSRPSARLTALINFRDNPNLHFIRLDDMLANKHLSNNELLKRFNTDLWNLNLAPNFSKAVELQRIRNFPLNPDMAGSADDSIGSSTRAAGASGPHLRRPTTQSSGPSGGAVWGGWAAGAILLALLVLFVRAAEKCVDKQLFKARRRRQSEEWPAANVTATSLQQQNIDLDSFANLDDSDYSPTNQRNDLPPPYSECASNNLVKNLNKINTEEPPPPYSACLVSFSNKDMPAVHLHRRQTDEPHTSSDIDNFNNDMIERHHLIEAGQSSSDETMRVELVFDNGRVVERTIDVESIDNVPEIVATVGDIVIGDRNPDDNENVVNADQNENQDRVVVV